MHQYYIILYFVNILQASAENLNLDHFSIGWGVHVGYAAC